MPIASHLLIALLVATPALSIAYEVYSQPAALLLIASMLAFAAMSASSSELAALKQALRHFGLALVAAVVWMIGQIVPAPIAALANPIWSTAAVALNDPSVTGRISIDPLATLFGLLWCIAILGVSASVILIAKDRRRAETVLTTLTVVGTIITLASLAGELSLPQAAASFFDLTNAGSLAFTSVLAALASGAIIVMAIERHLSRSEASLSIDGPLLLQIALGLCGTSIAVLAMMLSGRSYLLAPTGLGFSVMLFVMVVRRLGFRSWLATTIAAVLIIATALATLPLAQPLRSVDLLRYVGFSSPASLASARQALIDAPWLGNGVGTFANIARVYSNPGDGQEIAPPSAAASVAIEWGAPVLPVFAAFALWLFFFLLHGAVGRGRDSFYASLGAASVLCMLYSGLLDASLLTPTIQIFFATIVGLAISQSAGRTSSI